MSIEIRRGSGEKTPQFWSSEVSVMYGRTTLSDFRLISDVGRFQTTRLKTVKTRKTLIAIRPAVEDSRRCCTRLPYTFGPKGLQNRRGDRAAAPFRQVRGGLGELALSAPHEEDAARKHGRGREERDPHRKTGERKVPAGRRSCRAAGRAPGGRAGHSARSGGPGRRAGRAGRFAGGLAARRLAGRFARRLAGRFARRLAGRLAGRLARGLAGRFTGCAAGGRGYFDERVRVMADCLSARVRDGHGLLWRIDHHHHRTVVLLRGTGLHAVAIDQEPRRRCDGYRKRVTRSFDLPTIETWTYVARQRCRRCCGDGSKHYCEQNKKLFHPLTSPLTFD